MIQDRTFSPSKEMKSLRQAVIAERPTLVVLDLISVSAPLQTGNAVRAALEELAEIAHLSGTAILGITHFAKSTAKRTPGERIWGSYAYKAVPRMVMVASRSAHSKEMVLVWVKSNISAVGRGIEYRLDALDAPPDAIAPTRVEWGEVVEGTPSDIFATGKIVIAERPLQAAKAYLLDLLGRAPFRETDVYDFAKGAGHSRRTIEGAKGELGIVSYYEDRVSYWKLPEDASEDPGKPRRLLH